MVIKKVHSSQIQIRLYKAKEMNFTPEQIQTVLEVVFSSSSSNSDENEAVKPRKKRSCWVRPYYITRSETGAHHNIVETLCESSLNDPLLFKKYMRMSSTQFEELLLLVGPKIKKQTYIREPINESMRLAITLR